MELKAVNNLISSEFKQCQSGIEAGMGFEGLITTLLQTDTASEPLMAQGERREPRELLEELSISVADALKKIMHQNGKNDEVDNDLLLESALKGKLDGRYIKTSDIDNRYKIFLEKCLCNPDFEGVPSITSNSDITELETVESDSNQDKPEKSSITSIPYEFLIKGLNITANTIGLIKNTESSDETYIAQEKTNLSVKVDKPRQSFDLSMIPISSNNELNAASWEKTTKVSKSETDLNLAEIPIDSNNVMSLESSIIAPKSFKEIMKKVIAETTDENKFLNTAQEASEKVLADMEQVIKSNNSSVPGTFEEFKKNAGEDNHYPRGMSSTNSSTKDESHPAVTAGVALAAVDKVLNERGWTSSHHSSLEKVENKNTLRNTPISDLTPLSNSANISMEDTKIKNVSDIAHHEAPIQQLNKDELIDATVKSFKALRLPEITELKVRLKPQELGDISISVVLEKGQISGSITASNREVYNILQNGVDSLKQELKNNNLNLSNISVNIGNSGDFGSQSTFHHQGQGFKGYKGSQNSYKGDMSEHLVSEEEEGIDIIA